MTLAFAALVGLALTFLGYRLLDRPWPTLHRLRLRSILQYFSIGALAVAGGAAGWWVTRSAGAAVALAVAGSLARRMIGDWRASRDALARDREVQTLAGVTAETLAVYPAATHALHEVALGSPLWLRRVLIAALGNHSAGMPLRAALETGAAATRRRDLALYARLVAEAHETSAAAVESLRRLSSALRRRCDLMASRNAELAGQRILLTAAILVPPAAFGAMMVGLPWVHDWYITTRAGHMVSAGGAFAWTATLALAWRMAWRDEE